MWVVLSGDKESVLGKFDNIEDALKCKAEEQKSMEDHDFEYANDHPVTITTD